MSGVRVSAKAKTRVQEVWTTVRRDILRGALHPGEKLSPSATAQEYGVSLSVVREALTRMAEQGLVVSQPQLGFTVTPISREDLLDLTSVRLDIETLALRRSVENGDVEWRTALVAAHYRLEQTPWYDVDVEPPITSEEWALAHKRFHDTLLAACGSGRLLEIAESLRDSAELYRRWSAPIGGEHERDLVGEHRAIFEAAQSGDAETAVERLKDHISQTTDVLLKHAT
ncbi:DNA-binding GntR family transcriptional regulator [Micromonospora kangleipakensis]|uniref:DNA-binding GntR family transcriptional regulator n=1 Tax=Micromonospora kangleipakensis TaxID=1077942 RepID=A0A4Q8BCG5_9ACTN|nr:GntR family transcriptional regulator [Micromonospora kangleipakensis]RZU74945.1 DNA-binding GntR family transcriptional regulator [Micromonospora kangleipakensis]